jgi:DNA-binding NtrC family response regulator
VVTLRIPPLRERRDDIPALANGFLERFARENERPTPSITSDAVQLLKHAPWPGNVRELRNMMESLVILHPGAEIGPQQLPEELRRVLREADTAPGGAGGRAMVGKSMEEVERELILRTLEMTTGNRTQAADLLRIGLRTLQRKIKQYKDEGYPVVGSDVGGE